MTQQLSYYFLTSAGEALREVNERLGREPGRPNGAVDADASPQDMENHAALIELIRVLENLENWAVELSVRLEDAGVVELIREEP